MERGDGRRLKRSNLRQGAAGREQPSLHEGYHARWDCGHDDGEAPHLWRAEIPLTAGGLLVGRLEIVGVPDGEPIWRKMAGALTKTVEDAARRSHAGLRRPAL